MVTNSKKPGRVVPSAKNHELSADDAPSTSCAPLICPLPKSWMKYIGRSARKPTPLADFTFTDTPADPGADELGMVRPRPAGSPSLYTWMVRRARLGTWMLLVTGVDEPSTR